MAEPRATILTDTATPGAHLVVQVQAARELDRQRRTNAVRPRLSFADYQQNFASFH